MREIKFRVRYKQEWSPFEVKTAFLTLEEIANGHVAFTHSMVIIKSIDRFTGLKDKNGKEIYESDKLKRTDSKPYMTSEVHYSVNHGAWFAGATRLNKALADGCEVVGNTYESR